MSDTQVIFDMPFEDYLKVDALSSTYIKRITISIDDCLNADPRKETVALNTGKAYHKALLEGLDAFEAEYCREINKNGYVRTVVDAIAAFVRKGVTGYNKTGSRKYFMDLCRENNIPVYDDAIAGETRITLKANDYDRIVRCAKELHDTIDLPPMQNEVSVFWVHDGVSMKARFDGVNEYGVFDLKTFSNGLGKDLEKLPAQTIANYRYDIQAVLYVEAYIAASKIMPELFKAKNPLFNILWVQTHDGFNFDGTSITPDAKCTHNMNSYWTKALDDISEARGLYKKHVMNKEPLKRTLEFKVLEDHHLPMYYLKDDVIVDDIIEISAS